MRTSLRLSAGTTTPRPRARRRRALVRRVSGRSSGSRVDVGRAQPRLGMASRAPLLLRRWTGLVRRPSRRPHQRVWSWKRVPACVWAMEGRGVGGKYRRPAPAKHACAHGGWRFRSISGRVDVARPTPTLPDLPRPRAHNCISMIRSRSSTDGAHSVCDRASCDGPFGVNTVISAHCTHPYEKIRNV